jgi:hypothetical protein
VGGGEYPPPAPRLPWFENQLEMNISVASYLYFSDFTQRPLKRLPGSNPAGLRRAGVHIVGRNDLQPFQIPAAIHRRLLLNHTI